MHLEATAAVVAQTADVQAVNGQMRVDVRSNGWSTRLKHCTRMFKVLVIDIRVDVLCSRQLQELYYVI